MRVIQLIFFAPKAMRHQYTVKSLENIKKNVYVNSHTFCNSKMSDTIMLMKKNKKRSTVLIVWLVTPHSDLSVYM